MRILSAQQTSLPVAARLYRHERFQRALFVYNEAEWLAQKRRVTILVWSAMESLFGIGNEQNNTQATRNALSGYVAFEA